MSDVIGDLRKALGDRVHTDLDTREAHRSDSWVLAELRAFEERAPEPPLAVVRAIETADVVRCLEIARKHGVPVVPYGGGSGVCGGVETSGREIVLSTRGILGTPKIDSENLTARFGAGTLGIDAENQVRAEGLTIGHWPQSVEVSTVGGWVATRAAGQYSTAYGNIEDILLALEVVLPDGSVLRTRETPRASAGPDLRQIFLGSEGTLGVVTEVTFSLRPLPESEVRAAWHFADFDGGLEAIREIMRAGWRPPVLRLYDASESGRHFAEDCPPDRAMLIAIFEGPAAAVEAESKGVARICSSLGAENAPVSVVDHWHSVRNHVPAWRDFFERGLIVDTIEVAATWSRVSALYTAVTDSLREIPEIRVASAHSSHSYRSGTNLYFSFAALPDDPKAMEGIYRESWDRVMKATLACGGGIAHHHGIGRIRREYLEGEIGATGIDLLRKLKAALDPDDLLNPGNLLPPRNA